MIVRVDAVKPFTKNTLQAFVDLTILDIGLSIKGATLHVKNESRWIGLPAKPYQANGETTKWENILQFDSRASGDAFQAAALRAYDAFEGNG